MNTDSFTDEQLLNLVNNTIIEKTDYEPKDFTGGAIQATTSYKNKVITMKVILMFGYDKNNNSRSFQCEILEDTYYIWTRAILQKINSMLVKNTGADLNELNKLMNSKSERQIVDKKIVDRDRGSNIHSTNNSTNKKDKPFSFSLKQQTAVENLSKDYLSHLKAYIEEANKSLSYEEFINGLEAKGNKYKNFKSAYNTWAKNNDKWSTTPNGKEVVRYG